MNQVNCWICGQPANSREHRTKASDLRAQFKDVSQKSPVYLHTKARRNLQVGSIKKSSALKSEAPFCHDCNTTLTAPYDRAWEKLSEYLRTTTGLKKGSAINLSRVFPGRTKQGMLHVHLFFVKLFGCAIQELGVPIDLEPFRVALLNGTAHPRVRIALGITDTIVTGSSDLELASMNGRPAFATWFYVTGKIALNIMYVEPSERRKGLIGSWHPSTISKSLVLLGF